MRTTLSKPAFALPLITAFVLSIGATHASAQATAQEGAAANAPTASTTTPGMIGAQTVGSGRIAIGAASGYPETQLRVIFGLASDFDIGVFAGVTYGTARIAGLQQRVGLDLQVPIRWTLLRMANAAMALRIVPYFRIGQYDPAYSIGGLLGARFSIPLPKIFSIVVGPEVRLGFASFGLGRICIGTFCTGGGRENGFDGAAYAVLGLEAFVKEHWHFNIQFDGGGYFSSGNLANGGLFNAYAGFGYQF